MARHGMFATDIPGVLVQKSTLALTASQIGLAGSTYIAGAVLALLFFGELTVDGSFWIGATLGVLGSVVVLDPAIFHVDIGW